ncbi:hypothetical protein DESPIG_02555 [Desulfovibrio piger ATCC 29098]|uniref:Uncharacterized protein n=1 Tax=Desulfovibrio piger ATCC 29098 TaxID=411464 RepID=B6WWT6_9BACT|nr:hypothetical protein DESPIG_02555 [Desulfovibrio piger ATCC 29098]
MMPPARGRASPCARQALAPVRTARGACPLGITGEDPRCHEKKGDRKSPPAGISPKKLLGIRQIFC